MIHLLFIDDSAGDLELMKMYFKPITEVTIDTIEKEPSYSYCDKYDGIIVDQHLANGRLGIDYALGLARHNDMLPIMLYTGIYELETEDAKIVVDEICNKNDIADFGRNLSAFIRQINRIKALNKRIKELEASI